VTDPVRYTARPELRQPAMVVGWAMDAGRLGSRVTDYLVRGLQAQPFCEIEPVGFFPLSGVTIAGDVAFFPESRFYAAPDKDLVIFRSPPPVAEWYRFFQCMLSVAEACHVRQVFTVGSMIALGPHSAPRQLFGTMSSEEMKQELQRYRLTREVDYQTPPGGKPTLNSFFLWAARRRGIPGANLWLPVPFYLISSEDPAGYRAVIAFLNDYLGLELDLTGLNEQVKELNQRLDRLRHANPEVDTAFTRLEQGSRLSEGEGERLVHLVEEYLREPENPR